MHTCRIRALQSVIYSQHTQILVQINLLMSVPLISSEDSQNIDFIDKFFLQSNYYDVCLILNFVKTKINY